MLRAGLMRQQASSPGIYSMLPLGVRAMHKLTQIIHTKMSVIGGQPMSLPHLTPASLWKQSGRWDTAGHELIRLQDRRKQHFCLGTCTVGHCPRFWLLSSFLFDCWVIGSIGGVRGAGPTHEEAVTDLVTNSLSAWRQLPWRLYQITTKFRDEHRPRYGLIRGREFVMKDMYTFDVDREAAQATYDVRRNFDIISGNLWGSFSSCVSNYVSPPHTPCDVLDVIYSAPMRICH